jgi:DNA repair exonuclease SbcCD ATPase subunit
MAYTCTHVTASQPNLTEFQQKLEKKNKSIQISSTDTITTAMYDQIETLKKIQQNVDDFAFACDELATYHEQIYTLQDQIQTWLKNNQTTLNTFRGDIVTIDYEERKTLANASQEFIDALNKNSADQETLHKNAIQELATKHEKLQALYNTFINTYQTTLEQILPITQSVVAQDRARRTTNFDNALANKTETEALH